MSLVLYVVGIVIKKKLGTTRSHLKGNLKDFLILFLLHWKKIENFSLFANPK